MEKDSEQRLLVEIAKQQILNKLHLKERPNITSTVSRAALITALRKLHAGRVRPDGTIELEIKINDTKDQGYEIVSFAEMGKLSYFEHYSVAYTSVTIVYFLMDFIWCLVITSNVDY